MRPPRAAAGRTLARPRRLRPQLKRDPLDGAREDSVLCWVAPRLTLRIALCAFVCAVLPVVQALCQAPLVTRVLDSSTVVRLHFAQGGFGQGSLLTPFGPTSGTLHYCSGPSPRCVPRQELIVPAAAISRLEVQRGTRAGRGFLLGTGIAAVVVVPLFVKVGSLSEEETRGSLIAKGVLVSALIGGGLGALIGHTDPRWAPAP